MRLSHAEAQALISARLDGPLDPVAARELNAHLATCDSCRAFNASASQLARGLQDLPYLPASPAVTRAVLHHVSTPRSPLSWIAGALPANALPAATAIAVAVIVVFVGSFAAFGLLDEEDDPATIPASTLSVTDLAQGIAETAVVTEADDVVEDQAAVTEETPGSAVWSPATEESAPPTETAANPEATGGATEEAAGDDAQGTEPPSTSETSETLQAQLAPDTEEPVVEPTVEPTDPPAPTAEPAAEVTPSPGAAFRRILGLETAVPSETPATVPTDIPAQEPSPTREPTPTPTDEPAPVATESESTLLIVEPPPTATPEPTTEPTLVPTEEPSPTVEPTLVSTQEPTAELTAEPTATPTEEPTPEPTPEPTLEPTPELTPTVIPIEPRDEPAEGDSQDEEIPDAVPEVIADDAPETKGDESDNGGDDSSGEENRIEEIAPDDQADVPSGSDEPETGPGGDDEGEDGDATPASEQVIQEVESAGDEGDEQVILPAGGDEPQAPDDAVETPGDGNGETSGDQSDTADESTSLGSADIYASIGDIPGDPGERLGLSADGDLIFSSNPGRVSLESNGISLETGQGPTGQVVVACDANGSCVDISSASSSGGTTDTPIGWLDGEVIYERLNGDEYGVEFRAVAVDPDSLQPGPDRLIDGGGQELETQIRPYPVDSALLVPSPAGWLRIAPSSVEVVDGNPYGSIGLVRIHPGLGTISYVTGGTLVMAPLDAPGSAMLEIPFSGSDYDFSPDGSRVAVVTGSGIEILDTSGNVLATYSNDAGISLGSLAWLNEGLVFADLSNGVLRIIQP